LKLIQFATLNKSFQKITAILDALFNVIESGQNYFGEHGPLGVKEYLAFVSLLVSNQT
jgi:hypothetical protein